MRCLFVSKSPLCKSEQSFCFNCPRILRTSCPVCVIGKSSRLSCLEGFALGMARRAEKGMPQTGQSAGPRTQVVQILAPTAIAGPPHPVPCQNPGLFCLSFLLCSSASVACCLQNCVLAGDEVLVWLPVLPNACSHLSLPVNLPSLCCAGCGGNEGAAEGREGEGNRPPHTICLGLGRLGGSVHGQGNGLCALLCSCPHPVSPDHTSIIAVCFSPLPRSCRYTV